MRCHLTEKTKQYRMARISELKPGDVFIIRYNGADSTPVPYMIIENKYISATVPRERWAVVSMETSRFWDYNDFVTSRDNRKVLVVTAHLEMQKIEV